MGLPLMVCGNRARSGGAIEGAWVRENADPLDGDELGYSLAGVCVLPLIPVVLTQFFRASMAAFFNSSTFTTRAPHFFIAPNQQFKLVLALATFVFVNRHIINSARILFRVHSILTR